MIGIERKERLLKHIKETAEFLNQSMVHSGRNPLYDYQCCNPAVNDGESYICNSHEDSIISTPEWCPLRGK